MLPRFCESSRPKRKWHVYPSSSNQVYFYKLFKISFGSYVLLSLKTEYRHSNHHETKCKFYFALKIPNYMAFWRYKNIHIFFADQYERYWSIFNLHQCRDILNFDLCWSQEILHGVIVQMKRKLKWVGNAQMATCFFKQPNGTVKCQVIHDSWWNDSVYIKYFL